MASHVHCFRNHALVDGNKKLALSAVIAFLEVNGHRLAFDNDEAFEFIMDTASGQLDSVSAISSELRPHIARRGDEVQIPPGLTLSALL